AGAGRAAGLGGAAPRGPGARRPSGGLASALGPARSPPPAPVRLPADAGDLPPGFVTAPDGSFRIDAVPPRSYAARALAPGFAGGEAQVTAKEGATAAVTIALRRGTEVVARIVDEGGAPVAGAEGALLANGRPAGVAFAGADGRARFANVLGPASLRAVASGRAGVERALGSLPEAGSVEETLALAAAGDSISGWVVDGEER